MNNAVACIISALMVCVCVRVHTYILFKHVCLLTDLFFIGEDIQSALSGVDRRQMLQFLSKL